PPAPPMPPPPPPLGALPKPPLPPPPPAPPAIQDLVMFKILLQNVATDPGVISKLGSPVVMPSKDVDGSIQIGNGTRPDGDADMRFTLRGPKGEADVHVNAQLTKGEWSMDAVEIQSPVR
ncbi:MAG: cytochrome c oxidase assembly factor Coa1 family protein, partial [Arenimonas sp.]